MSYEKEKRYVVIGVSLIALGVILYATGNVVWLFLGDTIRSASVNDTSWPIIGLIACAIIGGAIFFLIGLWRFFKKVRKFFGLLIFGDGAL